MLLTRRIIISFLVSALLAQNVEAIPYAMPSPAPSCTIVPRFGEQALSFRGMMVSPGISAFAIQAIRIGTGLASLALYAYQQGVPSESILPMLAMAAPLRFKISTPQVAALLHHYEREERLLTDLQDQAHEAAEILARLELERDDHILPTFRFSAASRLRDIQIRFAARGKNDPLWARWANALDRNYFVDVSAHELQVITAQILSFLRERQIDLRTKKRTDPVIVAVGKKREHRELAPIRLLLTEIKMLERQWAQQSTNWPTKLNRLQIKYRLNIYQKFPQFDVSPDELRPGNVEWPARLEQIRKTAEAAIASNEEDATLEPESDPELGPGTSTPRAVGWITLGSFYFAARAIPGIDETFVMGFAVATMGLLTVLETWNGKSLPRSAVKALTERGYFLIAA